MGWRMDANSGITVIRWYDNGASYVGNQNGDKVIRWSANENKKIEIACPAMVQEYKGACTINKILHAYYTG